MHLRNRRRCWIINIEKKVMDKYGAFGEKKMYGKVTKGVIRSTVWLEPDGKLKKHWRTADHPAKVREAIQAAAG